MRVWRRTRGVRKLGVIQLAQKSASPSFPELTMAVMAWFKKERKPRASTRERLEIPPDAWEKCDVCGHVDIREKFERALNVCPECGHHRRFTAEEYIELLTDDGTWRELYANLRSADPLEFEHYPERLAAAQKKVGHADAIYAGTGRLEGAPLQSRGDELRLHGWLDGVGGRREDRPAGPALGRQATFPWCWSAPPAAPGCRRGCSP